MATFQSLFIMLWAGVCQLSDGVLLWQAVRGQKPAVSGISGAALLVAGGAMLSLLSRNVGRNFAAYGGVFTLLSLLWGWRYSHIKPDAIDLAGAAMVVGGIAVLVLTPRT